MNLKLKLETTKQKIIALILAIVSVILCVAIVLVTVISCSGGETGGGKTTKKVVKKKVIIVQEPDTDEEEDENTYYDVVDDDYDGPGEVVDTVFVPEDDADIDKDDNTSSSDDTASDTGSDDSSKYEVELEGRIKTPLSDKIGYGFWTHPGKWTEQFGDKYGKEGDIFTTCDIFNVDEARWCKENGASGWIKTLGGFVDDTAELKQSYMDNMISTAEAYKALGLWDVIEGFHFDEPLLKLTGEQFRALTKFLAETFPDKRIYPVCCTYEIAGQSSTKVYDAISYYNCGYITDIGLDWYGVKDIDRQRIMLNRMKEQVGRKDVRIWLFPTVFRQFASTDEDFMIDHLNMYYELLLEQENPGGLHLYNWTTHGSMTGFGDLTDPDLEWNYTRLLNRVIEIGKEIKNVKYTYKSTKN